MRISAYLKILPDHKGEYFLFSSMVINFKPLNQRIMNYIKFVATVMIFIFFAIPDSKGQVVGKVKTDDGYKRYKENSVVFIEYIDGEFTPQKKNPLINQIGLKFVPHVLPIIVGTTVEFLNSDDVLHNVFSPDSCANGFNLGTWPKNESKTHTYKELGCQAVVLCNVHPEMEAYVIVLQNPYFALTDKDGYYEINNLPPGKYTLKVWNERLNAEEKQIIVLEKGTIQVNFELIKLK